MKRMIAIVMLAACGSSGGMNAQGDDGPENLRINRTERPVPRLLHVEQIDPRIERRARLAGFAHARQEERPRAAGQIDPARAVC